MRTYIYRKSKLLRRAGSFVLDAIFSFVLMVFLLGFVVVPIVQATTDYDERYNDYETVCIESHIYEKSDAGGIALITSQYNVNLTYFYENYDSLETYNQMKEESGIFTYDIESNSYVVIEGTTESQLKEFYLSALMDAKSILEETDAFKEAWIIVEMYSMMMTLGSLAIAVLIFYMVPPLIFKDGATLGMKMFHLKVVSLKTGVNSTKIQNLCRFFVFYVFEFILMYYGLGFIFLIASGVMVALTPKRLSLPDFICGTAVIDGMDFDQNIPSNEQVLIVLNEDNKMEKKDDESN